MAKRRPITSAPRENRLLAALPKSEYDRLVRRMDVTKFGVRDMVYRPGGPMKHVYFPMNGVFSSVVVMADGGAVEVGTIGYEGMLGVALLLGADHSPTQLFCQVADDCWVMPAAAFTEEMRRGGPLADRVRRFAQASYFFTAQTTACNRLHSVEERCARWLLLTHDRVGVGQFDLTQEFLALMRGVRRASVTVAAGALQKAGLIEYTRGRISIIDRGRLEQASCECYQTVQDEMDRLLPPTGAA